MRWKTSRVDPNAENFPAVFRKNGGAMTHIEILESRIAPAAVYLVSSISKNITFGVESAMDTGDESAAAFAAGVNVAVLVGRG